MRDSDADNVVGAGRVTTQMDAAITGSLRNYAVNVTGVKRSHGVLADGGERTVDGQY